MRSECGKNNVKNHKAENKIRKKKQCQPALTFQTRDLEH
jgi:hypothetical protein